ncbi:dephospho-CoA kinase [Deinococcus soli (ex Cha et al. 2016)]|uniref:Dephospho-CoA kinase n=2 Tax=Deinococcus soli (ex Cha et al. 2016) TaxID=1309411 RepID=A0ACC6KII0_9DEIO|nr:dephospho-CoA kinase [Deinococcus soli (ex Cha et al. 2016)]MDR6219579.1 dephospho-CoA kinase [Deinococcus soli (ex Cha et al. 2016)]MDR6327258.1 dephospho-CoA kinase [Deinococcus soli (ex Cha et al. 2016)]MDR6752276.1 dephospho-CoA kinase [Deinococcus soli (ex Cha et al. 2016)]
MTTTQRIGLTGSIGAGKSTVAQLLRARGLTVLDADEQARLVTQDPEVLALLADRFPGVVVGGTLDRAALAARVFDNPAALADLNAITHPRVRARMAALEAQAARQGARAVVQDVPLLFEGGLDAQMDAVIVVDAPLPLRVGRVMARSGLTEAEVLARDARQLPATQKRARATVVIDNDRDLPHLEAQVDRALRQLGMVDG